MDIREINRSRPLEFMSRATERIGGFGVFDAEHLRVQRDHW